MNYSDAYDDTPPKPLSPQQARIAWWCVAAAVVFLIVAWSYVIALALLRWSGQNAT